MSFRIYSKSLAPEAIAKAVGIEPTSVQRKGDVLLRRAYRRHMWEYEVAYDASGELDTAVRKTLRALLPARKKIVALGRRAEACVWCGVFSDTPETSVALSAATAEALGAFRAQFIGSVYATAFEEPPRPRRRVRKPAGRAR